MKRRVINQELIFKESGTFKSYYKAVSWCNENGYSYGSMCYPQPIALFKGDYDISKWKNLTKMERYEVDGIMTGDFREGPVTILIYKKLNSDLEDERSVARNDPTSNTADNPIK